MMISMLSSPCKAVFAVALMAASATPLSNAFVPMSHKKVAATTRSWSPPTSKLYQSSRAIVDNSLVSLESPALPFFEDQELSSLPFFEDEELSSASFDMAQVGLSSSSSSSTVDSTARKQQKQFTPFQQFARAAPIVTMAGYAINPEFFDHGVEQVWSWIYNWDVTQTPLFEAHVATFSFFMSISFFSILHVILPTETLQKNRLDGQPGPAEDPLAWIQPEQLQLWFNPVVSYLVSIWIYQQVFHTYHPPSMLAPTFGVLVAEVLFGVFLYDLFFFPLHYMMHKSPNKIIRSWHGYHHRHTNGSLNSVETVQHGYIDGALQVLVNIMVQHISPFGGPKHMLSRILHNIIVTYMLSEAHSGYNFSWQTHNIWPEFLGGSPRHDRHHHDGRVYYQQFFLYLDDAMGLTDAAVQGAIDEKKKQKQQQSNAVVASGKEEQEAEEKLENTVLDKEAVTL
jgi:hypothetical protein